jgi:hypothetical protein
MATVLLITETKLKAFSTLHQNLDMSLLTSCIFIAQELGLQTLIGTKGYDYYTNLVKSVQLSGGTMSQPDRIMLDEYIAQYLVHRAYYEAMPEIYARRMNKAIVIGQTEQGQSIDIKGMSYMREIEMGRYEFYAQRLLDRVQAYPNDYGWFYTYTDKDGMPSTNQTYFAGIHFAPVMRRPPRRETWFRNLPYYQGPEYDACVDCG